MSSRSVKKRRHREDFQGYLHQRAVEKVAGGPMWQRLGFPTQATYQAYLDSKPKDGPQFGSQPTAHVHGPNCQHDDTPSDHWIDEPLTVEEIVTVVNADNEEGEAF